MNYLIPICYKDLLLCHITYPLRVEIIQNILGVNKKIKEI